MVTARHSFDSSSLLTKVATSVTEEKTTRKTVLVIEDEHQSRSLLLEHEEMRVLEAASLNEAAAIWRREGNSVDLIIADIWLPGISGP